MHLIPVGLHSLSTHLVNGPVDAYVFDLKVEVVELLCFVMHAR